MLRCTMMNKWCTVMFILHRLNSILYVNRSELKCWYFRILNASGKVKLLKALD